jgi:hypothetical protein
LSDSLGGWFAFLEGYLENDRRGIRFETVQSDVNSREDALKAYRRTRLKLLAWAPSDEDGN